MQELSGRHEPQAGGLLCFRLLLLLTVLHESVYCGELVSRGEMLQVFSNLIANGIDAMKEGGRLFISLRKTTALHGDGLQAIIGDDGIGISPENLQRIFEAFFTTKGNLGTGIGLWVTKQLVEARGGQIAVSSNTEPGKSGTRVTIFIPFAAPKRPGLMRTPETISEL